MPTLGTGMTLALLSLAGMAAAAEPPQMAMDARHRVVGLLFRPAPPGKAPPPPAVARWVEEQR